MKMTIAETNPHDHEDVVPMEAPIVSSYNDRIRPLLDTVDSLRNLNVMREGIQLPTIVVVGDQSSGKSSVLESLAGISLPRGQGICTRVPLVMRLQRSSSPEPEIWLEYSHKVVHTDEEHINEDICTATEEIAGSDKGISDAPLTLHVKKFGVPDLTMVDLPGITRVPVKGQPEDIYEQIYGMIMKYIEPQESIILNVLSATVDFTTCESIRMSRQVDKTGERTLAVVTKADMAPEGLLQKVTADEVSIGLGYVCVRNRIGDETYEEAREKEKELFKTPPLSLIDDEIVGIPMLAQKLTLIQAKMIGRCLPEIVRKINHKMETAVLELNKLPVVMASTEEASMALMDIIVSAKESLLKIIIQGDFSEFPDDSKMHSTARLADMLSQFSDNLQATPNDVTEFLMDEIKILEECKCVGLPNFIPRSAFLAILSKHVDGIHNTPVEFIQKIWDYIEVVLLSIITKYSENFPQIQSSLKRAGRNLIGRIKEQSVNRVIEIVEMEKLTDYTCNPEYMTSWTQKTGAQQGFIDTVLKNSEKPESFSAICYGLGIMKISHLRSYDAHLLQQAFDMNMRISSYWPIVLRRIVDNLALYLQLSVKNLVNIKFQKEILAEMVNPKAGGGVERMLDESPSMASKREKLKKSIKLLKECKDAIAAIADQNSGYGDL